MNFTFAHPQYLLLLLLVPLAIFIYFVSLRSFRKRALKFANFEAISKVKGVDILSKNISVFILSLIIIILLSLAVSGMVMHVMMQGSSFSFVLALDVSRSMEADDLAPTRIQAAKSTCINFVETSPRNTEIGVVSFSGNTYIEHDLTTNKDEVVNAIKQIQISSVEGTDIYEAVITSSNLLKNYEGKAMILLSDGQINVPSLEEAIEYANENDIIINTLGIGTEEGGKTSFGDSRINEESLKSLAFNTGGNYFKAETNQELEDNFNQMLDLTEKKVAIELDFYFVFTSLIIFFIIYVLINTKHKSLP